MDPRTTASLVRCGALLSEPARVRMLLALLDGRQRPATELAQLAAVTPQTASAHLKQLTEGGALRVVAQGRHRYYRLAGYEWAEALETLMALPGAPRAPAARSATAVPPLGRARLCYRHLAGQLGVAWADMLRRRGFLQSDGPRWRLTAAGREALTHSGLLPADEHWEPLDAKPCLDWTERRHHLAGPLANALTQRMLECRWLLRARHPRVLLPTAEGERRLRRLGLNWHS